MKQTALVIPGDIVRYGKEEALLPLDIVLINGRGSHRKGDRDTKIRPIRIVLEVLGSLYVVLVAIRPVEMNLLTVVRDYVRVL